MIIEIHDGRQVGLGGVPDEHVHGVDFPAAYGQNGLIASTGSVRPGPAPDGILASPPRHVPVVRSVPEAVPPESRGKSRVAACRAAAFT